MPKTGADVLRNSEQNAIGSNFGQPSFYSGNGRDTNTKNNKGARFLGSKKTIGAMLIIMCLIGAGGTFLSSSHSMLGPAMETLITQQTDTQYAYTEAASTRIFGEMLSGDSVVSNTWAGTKKYARIPAKLQKNLARQGIKVVGSGNEKYLTFKGETITANNFSKFYYENGEFRKAYTTAKRGRILGFFDNVANKIYNKLGISRNLYNDYHQTGDAEADVRQFDETVTDKLDTSGAKTSTRSTTQGQEYQLDENGNPIPDGNGGYLTEEKINSATEETKVSSKTTKAEAEVNAGSFISNIAGNVKQAVNMGCTGVSVGNLIAVTVAAATMYKVMNIFLSGQENISKTMAGFGSESAINPFMNRLTTPTVSMVEDYGNIKYERNGVTENNIDNLKVTVNTIPMDGTAVESNGFQAALAGVTPNLKETENYSLEKTINAVSGALTPVFGFTTSSNTIKHCLQLQRDSAFASIAISLIPGVGEVHIFSQVLLRVGVAVATTVAISAFLSFLIPTVAEALFTNNFPELKGLAYGETYMSGAYAANSKLGQEGSGQTVGSTEMLSQYNHLNNDMIALENELDRLGRSPFDLTSKNTFLGSIAFNLFPLLSVRNTSSLNTLITTTSNSIASLSNKTFATSYNSSTFSSYTGSCPLQESIGIDCNMYGYPKIGSDVSIINTPANDPEYTSAIAKETTCDSEGDCEVNKDGELYKYINLCTYRESPFGFTDYNILNSLSKASGFVIGAISALPLIGDVIDIFTSQEYLNNLPWATGEICKMSSNNPKWNEFKQYQKYIGEMRIIDDNGGFNNENDEDDNNSGKENEGGGEKGVISEERTTVTIPGLQNNYKIAWVSDLHLVNKSDAGTSDRYNYSVTPDGVHAEDYLDTIINYLNNGGFDAVIFGGDMLDYYSPKNAETLTNGLNKLTIPWFYIYGSVDHDQSTRFNLGDLNNSIFTNGSSNSNDVIDLGEFKIVGLNNSSEKNITSSDLDPVTSTIQNAGKPVLLATHVPFASKIDNDNLKKAISEAHRGAAYYWTNGSSNWELSNNTAMQNFLNNNIYDDNTNVKAVFAGHVHDLSNDTQLTNSVKQHIFKSAFSGSVGVITVTGNDTTQNNIVDYDIPNRNPIIAAREQWLEDNPTDNSPAGYLARISGLTKEDANLVLDIVAYYTFINDYDASTRLAMNGDASNIKSANLIVAEIQSQKSQEHPLVGDGEAIKEYAILISQDIIYADLRNRSHVA